ncbi:MAG: hypothetical protein ACEQSX_03605 [Baekduiaceae bacterium]
MQVLLFAVGLEAAHERPERSADGARRTESVEGIVRRKKRTSMLALAARMGGR